MDVLVLLLLFVVRALFLILHFSVSLASRGIVVDEGGFGKINILSSATCFKNHLSLLQEVTTDPYFCLYTAEVGMVIADCWKIYKLHHKLGGFAPTIGQFVDITALQMVEYAKSLVEFTSVSVQVEDFESCVSSVTTTGALIINT